MLDFLLNVTFKVNDLLFREKDKNKKNFIKFMHAVFHQTLSLLSAYPLSSEELKPDVKYNITPFMYAQTVIGPVSKKPAFSLCMPSLTQPYFMPRTILQTQRKIMIAMRQILKPIVRFVEETAKPVKDVNRVLKRFRFECAELKSVLRLREHIWEPYFIYMAKRFRQKIHLKKVFLRIKMRELDFYFYVN